MRTFRRFQPIVDGLPYRIAPSGLVVAPAVSAMALGDQAAHASAAARSEGVHVMNSTGAQVLHSGVAHPPLFSPADTDMTETGTGSVIIAAPPPSSGSGTQVC
jgi:hypothetical protein